MALKREKIVVDGKPLKPYHYRDFGSLVSLGKYSTVGSMMGGLIGAGLGGLLFGHGLFGGFTGFGSLIGLMLQLFLVYLLVFEPKLHTVPVGELVVQMVMQGLLATIVSMFARSLP